MVPDLALAVHVGPVDALRRVVRVETVAVRKIAASAGNGSTALRVVPFRRGGLVGHGLRAAVAALALLGAVACGGADGPAFELRVSDAPGGRALVRLDPATLVDDGVPPIALTAPAWSWVFSSDGSTVAGLDNGADPTGARALYPTVVVRERASGAERRFPAPAQIVAPRLSRDGRRLVVDRQMTALEPGVHRWYVLDTATGEVRGGGGVGGPVAWTALDPDATRLLRLVSSADAPFPEPGAAPSIVGRPSIATGPGRAQLTVHDLLTGAELGQVELSDVLAGSWPSGRTAPAGGEPIDAYLWPGVALSPDGRRVAVAHADAERITLIDVETMAVERTLPLRPPTSLWEWLPFAPRSAHAKYAEGTGKTAVFAPDGRRLYVWGHESRLAEDGRLRFESTGLVAVDVPSGTVTGRALVGHPIARVVPAPDGRSVYVLGRESPAGLDDLYVLRRLDAAGLAPLAEQRLLGSRALFATAAPVLP
jgi:hypothetical protein